MRTFDRNMKLLTVFLSSILIIVTAESNENSSNHVTRLLADRNVPISELKIHTSLAVGLWTSLNGIVYDLTTYKHPGGAKYLVAVGGIEGDALYQKGVAKNKHPFSLAAVVKLPGIVRIGPLTKDSGPAPTLKLVAGPTAMPITKPSAMHV